MSSSYTSIALLVGVLPLFACADSTPAPPESGAAVREVRGAFDLAGELPLGDLTPEDRPDLHNVFELSDGIISGGEPHSEEALARLAEMGVKTIVSVDGKVPEAEAASRHGMRYVHVPIRYSGIEDDELMRLAKTFRELDAPFYVHCFHGRHRGPAAAAVGRIVLDGATRQRAAAEMRQWCGTSSNYEGLYETVVSQRLPTAQETSAYRWDFPAAHPMQGFREAMVDIARAHDHLKALSERDFEIDPSHPDIDALNEAEILLGHLRAAAELEEIAGSPEDLRGWLADGLRASEELAGELRRLREGRGDAATGAIEAMGGIGASCKACHAAYRNG